MVKFVLKRILYAIPVLFFITIVSFAIIKLAPGDYASNYKSFLVNYAHMPEQEAETAAAIIRREYGLDKPMLGQYFAWIKGIVTEGKFGYSFAYKRDVSELFLERLPRTLVLALVAHLLATLGGIFIGIYSATHQYSITDNAATVIAFLGTCLPRFFLGLFALYALLFWAGVKEMGGWSSTYFVLESMSWAKALNIAAHVWPVVAIAGLGGISRNFRVMRGNLLDVLSAQYVTTARSKGLSEGKVIMKHAVPNALHPIIMYQGMVLPYMIQGELETSIVLSIPTLAPLFYTSLQSQDIYVSAGCLLIYAIVLVIGNILSDVLLAVMDPRVSQA
ncbi:ABC transporter permease [Leadbettera azotonutricia]|uniref:Oligopeptide transport system permease protein AppB n=1 Tax=Leadbettera azotonutricia (strain ATCC BAA-888 / DSM 13862 / ZAS-9) TaxID=545695 RepID=F5Y7E8_LEAAZ|nr:ABC transporter permease [Leadbettera azotonutricia]AEF80588.1 oligopeptide transport system permease protein AppB [Leadbettera azotonutricia ZAS-9]